MRVEDRWQWAAEGNGLLPVEHDDRREVPGGGDDDVGAGEGGASALAERLSADHADDRHVGRGRHAVAWRKRVA